MQKYLSKRPWKLPAPQWPWQHLSWKSQWHFCPSAPHCYDPRFSFGLLLLLTLLLSQVLPITEVSSLLHKARVSATLKKTAAVCSTNGFQLGPSRNLARFFLEKPSMCKKSMRGNRKVVDHCVRVVKQNWVSLTQWKVRAEMERITSKNKKDFMKKGELGKEVNQRLM